MLLLTMMKAEIINNYNYFSTMGIFFYNV